MTRCTGQKVPSTRRRCRRHRCSVVCAFAPIRRMLHLVARFAVVGAGPRPSRCGALASRRWAIMDVYEAVMSRRAVRGFTDRPVPKEVLERVLSAAAWAPSGSNIQPWHVYVLTGGPACRAQEARRRARGRKRPLGRAGIRDVPARTEVPVPRAPSRLARSSSITVCRYMPASAHWGRPRSRSM